MSRKVFDGVVFLECRVHDRDRVSLLGTKTES